MNLTNISLLKFEVEEIEGEPVVLRVNSMNGVRKVNFLCKGVALLGSLKILLFVRVLNVVLSVLPVLHELLILSTFRVNQSSSPDHRWSL